MAEQLHLEAMCMGSTPIIILQKAKDFSCYDTDSALMPHRKEWGHEEGRKPNRVGV